MRPRVPAWAPALILGAALRVLLYAPIQAKSWLWLPVLEGSDYLRRAGAGWKGILAPPSPPLGSFFYPGILRVLGVEERADLAVLFVFQNVLGLASLLLLYVLVRRFARPWVAGLAAALWALVPIFPYWEHQVSPAAAMVVAVLALALAMTAPRPSVLAVGILGGVAATLVPIWTWPLLIALLLWAFRAKPRTRAMRALATGGAFVIVTLLMLVSGFRSHVPPTLSWGTGFDAYIGDAPGASGTFGRDAPVRWRGYTEYLSEVNETEGRAHTQVEAGRILAARARLRALADPGRTLVLEAKKVALALSPRESPQVRSPAYALHQTLPAAAGLLALEWILVPIGVAGLVLAARRRSPMALLAIVALVPLLFTFVSSSGRLPLLALLAAGGAVFIEALVSRAKDAPTGTVVALAALVLFGLAVKPAGINDASEETRIAGMLASQNGNRSGAIERAQEAVRLDSTNVAARINLAALLAEDGVYPQAAGHLAAALAADSTNVSALLGLASLEQRLDNQAGAVPLYRRALEQRPRNPQTWNDLGGAYLKSGAIDSAVVCFNRALAISPSYSKARENLATVQGAIAANQALFDAVVPASASDEEKQAFASALGAANHGETGPAEALLPSLPRKDGDLRRPYLSALIALQKGDNRKAADELDACYRAAPGNAYLAYQLAQTDQKIGRLDAAIAVIEDAIRYHPQEPSLMQTLQQFRAQTQ